MAGRLVFQQLAPGMSRSTSRLVGARASAASRAAAPAMPFASEHGGRFISKLFHAAAAAAAICPAGSVLPSISNHGAIRCHPTAKYLNTLPCLPPRRVPAKIRRLKANKMSPSINDHNKSSALVDSLKQVKPTCSPDASKKLNLVEEPWHRRLVDWVSKKKKGLHRIDLFLIKLLVMGNLMSAAILYTWSEDVSTSSMIPSQSLHCPGCNGANRLHCSGCNCPSRR